MNYSKKDLKEGTNIAEWLKEHPQVDAFKVFRYLRSKGLVYNEKGILVKKTK